MQVKREPGRMRVQRVGWPSGLNPKTTSRDCSTLDSYDHFGLSTLVFKTGIVRTTTELRGMKRANPYKALIMMFGKIC